MTVGTLGWMLLMLLSPETSRALYRDSMTAAGGDGMTVLITVIALVLIWGRF